MGLALGKVGLQIKTGFGQVHKVPRSSVLAVNNQLFNGASTYCVIRLCIIGATKSLIRAALSEGKVICDKGSSGPGIGSRNRASRPN